MAQFLIEDLDSEVIEKLNLLAQKNGRSLQAELKHILEKAALSSLSKDEIILKKAEKMRQQIINHAGQDISELPLINREKALQKLAELKEIKKISSTGMSIREMREEGRRF